MAKKGQKGPFLRCIWPFAGEKKKKKKKKSKNDSFYATRPFQRVVQKHFWTVFQGVQVPPKGGKRWYPQFRSQNPNRGINRSYRKGVNSNLPSSITLTKVH